MGLHHLIVLSNFPTLWSHHQDTFFASFSPSYISGPCFVTETIKILCCLSNFCDHVVHSNKLQVPKENECSMTLPYTPTIQVEIFPNLLGSHKMEQEPQPKKKEESLYKRMIENLYFRQFQPLAKSHVKKVFAIWNHCAHITIHHMHYQSTQSLQTFHLCISPLTMY